MKASNIPSLGGYVNAEKLRSELAKYTSHCEIVASKAASGKSDTASKGYAALNFVASALNAIRDATAPTVASANIGNVDDTTITILFSEALREDIVPAPTAFTGTVDQDGGGVGTPAAYTVTAVEVVGNAVRLTIDTNVGNGATVLVTYTAPATNKLQDSGGNTVVSFSNQAVSNTVPV